MGPATVTANLGCCSGGSLNMEKFPVTGYAKPILHRTLLLTQQLLAQHLPGLIKLIIKKIGLSYAKIDPAKKSRPLQNIVDVMKDNGYGWLSPLARLMLHLPVLHTLRIVTLENAEQVKVSNLDLVYGWWSSSFLPQGSSYKGKRKMAET